MSKSRPGNGSLFVRGQPRLQRGGRRTSTGFWNRPLPRFGRRGLLDGVAVDLGDLFRHVRESQPVLTVTKMDVVLALHQMGLVPESHVEQASENLEAEKQDLLLPSLMPEEPDREDDREM